jgi:glycosyltransferase involved in cell wall biosynthesis
MKITFISNFMNHHQLPLCLELVRLIGDDFIFLSTTPLPDYRKKLGYESLDSKYGFVKCLYENNMPNTSLVQIIDSTDTFIIGSISMKLLNSIDYRKNIFFYRERIFKRGVKDFFNLKILTSIFYNHYWRRSNSYLLCASSYTYVDYRFLGLFKGKSFKWGYFPVSKEYNFDKIKDLKNRNTPINILWVGRLINWKHPEFAIKIAKKLKEDRIDFILNIVGNGEMFTELNKQIFDLGLTDYVKLRGSMNPFEVRKIMERSNILLITSSIYEGWGAVVNEGMNSCCVVISSQTVGSASYLIKNKHNGFICEFNNIEQFVYVIKENINNRKLSIKIGINAYKTIISEWNAKIAAERFLYFCNNFDNLDSISFSSGPLSRA